MYTQYESRQERKSRDFDRNDETYDAVASSATSTTYRSALGPRVTNFHRSRTPAFGASGVNTSFFRSHLSSGGSGNFGPGLAGIANFSGVPLRGGGTGGNTVGTMINTNRLRDKHDLGKLNDKFAQYVEKVRFLEAHNRKLTLELEVLQGRSGL